MDKGKNIKILLLISFIVWTLAHVSGVSWGTQNIPMHQTYVADEQRPVNGALHMLNEKSIFGLRDKKEFWYGPIFAVLATPAIVIDFAKQVVFDGVRSAQDYKDNIIFDWGGVVLWLHVTVVLATVLMFFFIYRMFLLKTLNSTYKKTFAVMALGMVAVNYFVFVYSNIFVNWMFVLILLVVQLYVGLLIYESDGKEQKYWWMHGIITVLNFGINYFNAVYLIAYVPLAIKLWMKNEEGVRKKLYIYSIILPLGFAFIIWWNPFTFIRLLGFLGIGSMSKTINTALNNTFTPFYSEGMSFAYYGKVIMLNHISIFIAFTLLWYPIFVQRFKENFMWIWMFGSVGVVQFIIFGSLAHNEPRYVLITIVMLLLIVSTAFIKYLTLANRKRIIIISVAVLLVWYAGFHLMHIGKWIDVYSDGPAEKQMISKVLDAQKDGESIVLVQNSIAGHVHTKEAYMAFMKKKNAENVNLYKAIMSAPLPKDLHKLDVRYVDLDEYNANPHIIDSYVHAVKYVQVCSLEINQANYISENILSLWFWDECKPRYEFIK